MRDELRAGVAIYNAGEYHAAHDAWEDYWLDLDAGTDDERLLHGLIQFTAAMHHARNCNWTGLSGLVECAREYLDGLPADYRGIDLATVRAYLDALHEDPEYVERVAPPALTHEGEALALSDLDFPAAAIAAAVFAEEKPGFEEEVVEQAVEYAHADFEAEEATSQFVALVMDFARDEANRGIVYQRLTQHVDRRASRERDVEGLFDVE